MSCSDGIKEKKMRFCPQAFARVFLFFPKAALWLMPALVAVGCSSGRGGAGGHLGFSEARHEFRPEIASADLVVQSLGFREASISLTIALAPPDIENCMLKDIQLEWLLDGMNFASSAHALHGQPCLSTDHGADSLISVNSTVSYLSLPMMDVPGMMRRMTSSQVSIRGTLTVQIQGDDIPIYFAVQAPPGQGTARPMRR